MAKRRQYSCRYPGCRTRRTFDSPAAVMTHRHEAHGEDFPATRARKAREAKARKRAAKTAERREAHAANPGTPARPPMARVTLESMVAKLPDLVLESLDDSSLVGELAKRLERKTG